MRNIHALNQQIYITTDEEIKEGDFFLYDETTIRYKTNGTEYHGGDLCHISGNRRYPVSESKKIILTTNPLLDGVQAIDDEFLEWFVNNSSFEFVEVEKQMLCDYCGQEHCDNLRCRGYKDSVWYEIIIPKEEPKQETTYSYDEARQIAYLAYCLGQLEEPTENKFNGWIQQFKK